MSKDWYTEMLCEKCRRRVGYYVDCGPGSGCAICVDCYESEPSEEEEEEEEEEND